jgi:hypothetical protein
MDSTVPSRSLVIPLAAIMTFALLLVPAMVQAQVDVCAITGVVIDPSGAVLQKASVTAAVPLTGFVRTVRSNANGTYVIPNLQPGVYNVSAQAAGFKKVIASGLRLYVGQTVTQDLRLEIGDTKESITVTAAAALLNLTDNQIGTVITNNQITELPLNGRNFLQLNLLSPGVIHNKTSNTFEAIEINPTATSFSVNGQKSDYNNYLVDGVVMKENEIGTNTFSPSVEAIGEFQTSTSNYSAAMGSEAGAQVNLTLKPGTNQLHGAVWEFLRNNAFDARNFFQVGAIPPYHQNQFGVNLSGPVRLPKLYNGRDKTFFMFNYEGFRMSKFNQISGLVPTPAEIGGDLSALATPAKPVIDPWTGNPFPGNKIPQDRIRPAALLGFLQNGIGAGPWVPLPNVAGDPSRNYVRNDPTRFTGNQIVARIDHQLSDKTSIYGHLAFNRETLHSPQFNPNWWLDRQKPADSVGVHMTHIFTPNLLLDVAAGYSYYQYNYVKSTDYSHDITNNILKILGNATVPGSYGAPSWGIAGFSNLGETTFGPRLWEDPTISVRPSFTWVKGRHEMRWGLDFEHREMDFQEIFQTDGNYSFTGLFSNYGLGDFLLDLPASIAHSPDPFAPDFRQKMIAPYFQDDWKVTSNLTLSLGLRYERTGIPLSANKRSVSTLYFPPNGASPQLVIADDAGPINFRGVQATLFTGVPFVRAGSVGMPEALSYADNKDFAPRFGFAYKVPGVSDAVVRGGYGIFYQNDINDNWTGSAINAPFVRTALTTLDKTNFQSFDPSNPYVQQTANAAGVQWQTLYHHQAMVQAWNLAVEKTVKHTLFSAAYVGNMGHHLKNLENPNQAVPGPGAIASRRQWTDWGVLSGIGENGNANYHSLQAKVQKNFSNGFSLLSSYTFAKCIDDTGGAGVGEGERGGITQNFADRAAERGLCAQDIRHRFVTSYVYELPFGKGKHFMNHGGAADWVLGGWQINGITTISSGSPSTITQIFNGANTDSGTMRPDRIGNPNDLSHSRSRGAQVAEWFDIAAFQQVDQTNGGAYRFGNSGRDIMIGPGDYIWDMAMLKNFHIREKADVQFRAEAFNLMNRPTFAKPVTSLGDPNFGKILSTSHDSRDIQFALKLRW